MMWSEDKTCTCGFKVKYYIISDAHDPDIARQFVFTRPGEETPVTSSICPKCKKDLFETTGVSGKESVVDGKDHRGRNY